MGTAADRIREEISSSNFRRFDRNLNTGEPCGTGTTWTKAQGQRTLSSFPGKDLHQEVGTPARHATLHDVALFARMLLDQAECQAA
jgi:predicted acyl esterase